MPTRSELNAMKATIEAYLTDLRTSVPRGRRTVEWMTNRLAEIEATLPDADILTQVHLVQERIDLESDLKLRADSPVLEKAFIEVVLPYSAYYGITYAAWRQVKIPAAVLIKGGMSLSS